VDAQSNQFVELHEEAPSSTGATQLLVIRSCKPSFQQAPPDLMALLECSVIALLRGISSNQSLLFFFIICF
jgi:hypothetical protein